MNILFELEHYRIIEVEDPDFTLDELKGDLFDPTSDLCPEKLREAEIDFENQVREEGVYGYVLERWNPEIGCGWEELDSCWGFVGRYGDHEHYIVEEFVDRIQNERRNALVGAVDE